MKVSCLRFALSTLFTASVFLAQEELSGREGDAVDLLRLIQEGIPKSILHVPSQVGDKDDFFAWSPVSNGLACRIEYARRSGYAGYTVFMRLENRSGKQLTVPMGNPADTKLARTFELYARSSNDAWQRVGWLPRERLEGPGPEIPWDGILYKCMETGNIGTRKDVVLKPGESALVYLCGSPALKSVKASEIRIILNRPETSGEGRWQGSLESGAFPVMLTEEKFKASAGLLTCPDHLPELNHRMFMGGNMSGDESDFDRLQITNYALLDVLELYVPTRLRTVLEGLMGGEKDVSMKLMLASEAVTAGSEKAALFILNCMSDTDYTVVCSTHDALKRLLYRYDRKTPRWLVALVSSVLRDERDLKGAGRKNVSLGPYSKISDHADVCEDLTLALGNVRCTEAVPLLIERVRHTNGWPLSVYALGMIGDERSIPVLMEVAKKGTDELNLDVVGALANLKAKEAVPLLLEHLRYREVIEALDHIGDARALPMLEQLIKAKGMIDNHPDWNRFDWPKERLSRAKIAAACMDTTSRTKRLCELLTDPMFGEFDRRLVVWRLGDEPDTQAIPFLIRAIKADPSGVVVNQSIAVLRAFRHKEAIVGLIDCLDASFERKSDWKRANSPDEFRGNIATTLLNLTGQDIGTVKADWLKWWAEHGETMDWTQSNRSRD